MAKGSGNNQFAQAVHDFSKLIAQAEKMFTDHFIAMHKVEEMGEKNAQDFSTAIQDFGTQYKDGAQVMLGAVTTFGQLGAANNAIFQVSINEFGAYTTQLLGGVNNFNAAVAAMNTSQPSPNSPTPTPNQGPTQFEGTLLEFITVIVQNQQNGNALLAQMVGQAAQMREETSTQRRAQVVNIREPKDKKEDKTLIDKGIDRVIKQLVFIIAPLTAFATILNSASSGFRVFLGAINVLAGVIAPILLPIFILLSALLLSVADVIWNELEPALEDWYTFIITNGMNAIQTFIDWLGRAVTSIGEYISALRGLAQKGQSIWKDLGDGLTMVLAKLWDFFTGDKTADEVKKMIVERDAIKFRNPNQDNNKGNGKNNGNGNGNKDIGDAAKDLFKDMNMDKTIGNNKNGDKDFMQRMRDNLKLSVQELRFQNGPKASFTSLTGASRAAQLAAFNESPFEKKMLERMNIAIGAIERVVDKLDKPPVGR